MHRQNTITGLILHIAILLCLPTILLAAEADLMSTSISSVAFSAGAGWNGYEPARLQINDTGDVCFLAPMPEKENSVAARFIASYMNYGGVVSQLHSGLDAMSAMFGMTLRTTNTEVVCSQDFSTIAVLCDERLTSASASTAAILYLQNRSGVLDRIVLGQSPGCLASECHLEMGDGRLLVYGHGYGVKLFDVSNGTLKMSQDLSATIVYNGEFLAMPKNSDCIFYAAAKSGYGLSSGQNGIFSHSIADGKSSLVAKAGRTSLDPQLAVSGDGSKVAYRRLENAIAIAQKDGDAWKCIEPYPIMDKGSCYPSISMDGRFIAYQCASEECVKVKVFDTLQGKCSLAIESPKGDCFRPSVSPNGEYIAFATNGTADGTYQVFRTRNNISSYGDDWLVLDLKKGWNLKSIHFTLDDKSWQTVQNLGDIWIWNGSKFALHKEKLKSGMGFWINASANTQLFLSGKVEEATPLRSGWNLVCPITYESILAGKVAFKFDEKSRCYVRFMPEAVGNAIQKGVWLFMP
jgi:hypothetical protein